VNGVGENYGDSLWIFGGRSFAFYARIRLFPVNSYSVFMPICRFALFLVLLVRGPNYQFEKFLSKPREISIITGKPKISRFMARNLSLYF